MLCYLLLLRSLIKCVTLFSNQRITSNLDLSLVTRDCWSGWGLWPCTECLPASYTRSDFTSHHLWTFSASTLSVGVKAWRWAYPGFSGQPCHAEASLPSVLVILRPRHLDSGMLGGCCGWDLVTVGIRREGGRWWKLILKWWKMWRLETAIVKLYICSSHG